MLNNHGKEDSFNNCLAKQQMICSQSWSSVEEYLFLEDNTTQDEMLGKSFYLHYVCFYTIHQEL